jgi:hypothetical protein
MTFSYQVTRMPIDHMVDGAVQIEVAPICFGSMHARSKKILFQGKATN